MVKVLLDELGGQAAQRVANDSELLVLARVSSRGHNLVDTLSYELRDDTRKTLSEKA